MVERYVPPWRGAMGYNAKEVRETDARVGFNASEAGRRNRGEAPLSQLELLALTAPWAGLPPWSEELVTKFDSQLRRAADEVHRCAASRSAERNHRGREPFLVTRNR